MKKIQKNEWLKDEVKLQGRNKSEWKDMLEAQGKGWFGRLICSIVPVVVFISGRGVVYVEAVVWVTLVLGATIKLCAQHV